MDSRQVGGWMEVILGVDGEVWTGEVWTDDPGWMEVMGDK